LLTSLSWVRKSHRWHRPGARRRRGRERDRPAPRLLADHMASAFIEPATWHEVPETGHGPICWPGPN